MAELQKTRETSKVNVINGSMKELFFDLLDSTQNNLYFSSPYIKNSVANNIIDKIDKKLNRGLDCKILHSFKLMNYFTRSSDLEAIKTFNSKGIFSKNVSNLHAKMYIFDNRAIITSGNLTHGGMTFNIEYGVMLEGSIVKKVKQDFLDIYNNIDYKIISDKDIDLAERIINEIPAEKTNTDNNSDILHNSEKIILKNLSGWKKDVFEFLTKIPEETFTIDKIYSYKDIFEKKHPANKNIEAKIRQQLQFLRDLGLIDFTKKGIYTKKWR